MSSALLRNDDPVVGTVEFDALSSTSTVAVQDTPSGL